jgi:hypothetical protein
VGSVKLEVRAENIPDGALSSSMSSIPPLRFLVVTDELEVDVECLEHHVHRKRLSPCQ